MSDYAASPTTPPPGWYTDTATGHQRWWTGTEWGQYAPAQAPQAAQSEQRKPSQGMAITALVLGIFTAILTMVGMLIGHILVLAFLTFLPSVLAIVFGAVATASARRRGSSSPIGITGLILGALPLFASLIMLGG